MSKLLKPTTDPAYDIWRSQHQPLRPILAPEAVALIGATERPGSVGRTLLWNLISSPFGGSIFPVNPKRRNVLGIRAYPNVYSLPEPVDLAVIATPASSVPDLIGDCVEVGIKGAIVISAGFREIGAAGLELGGSVLLFGTGGELVEVFRDRAIALPPLNTTLARRLMEQTKIYQALKGVRGRRAVNLSLLEKLLVKFSYLVVEQSWIQEIDINPLLASAERLIALDARITLYPYQTPPSQLPQPAIRPYPRQYTSSWTLRDGTPVTMQKYYQKTAPCSASVKKSASVSSGLPICSWHKLT